MSKAWRKAEYEELWLQFRPRGSKDVLEAVEAAVRVANQEAADAGWSDDAFTEGVSDSDAGPVALMSRTGAEQGVRAWLDAFARQLQSLGLAGKVTAAPQVIFPRWLNNDDLAQQLTVFAAYRTDDLTLLEEQERRMSWAVPAELTARVTHMGSDWGRFEGADVYLQRSIHQTLTRNPDVGQALASGAARFGQAGVTYLRTEPRRKVSMSLSTQGRVCYSIMDDTMLWQDRLARLAEPLLAFPVDTDLAFVQHSKADTTTWDDLSNGRPALPYVRESQIRYNRHLSAQYIPDAHGVQLLTDAHLAHANDLSEWIIEPLGGGRHLVQAKDMEPWYAQIDPDPQTLAQARADFGGMLLTPEIIANNPPPWK
ncbi:hypothetical protein [Arthrobacter sp. R-11]|uniref:hypothetical protein n=1 Tax=Arthrobacter sp. R-11 TaxID=3404053 RepID=UPI003CF30487